MATRKTQTIDQLVASLDARLSELASEINRLLVLRAELLARKTPRPRRHIHAGSPLVVTVGISNGRAVISEPQIARSPVPFARPMDAEDLPEHTVYRN
jgi:hypothetical protein